MKTLSVRKKQHNIVNRWLIFDLFPRKCVFRTNGVFTKQDLNLKSICLSNPVVELYDFDLRCNDADWMRKHLHSAILSNLKDLIFKIFCYCAITKSLKGPVCNIYLYW